MRDAATAALGMRFSVYALASTALVAAIAYQGYEARRQFYPTLIYLTSNKLSLLALGNEALMPSSPPPPPHRPRHPRGHAHRRPRPTTAHRPPQPTAGPPQAHRPPPTAHRPPHRR